MKIAHINISSRKSICFLLFPLLGNLEGVGVHLGKYLSVLNNDSSSKSPCLMKTSHGPMDEMIVFFLHKVLQSPSPSNEKSWLYMGITHIDKVFKQLRVHL